MFCRAWGDLPVGRMAWVMVLLGSIANAVESPERDKQSQNLEAIQEQIRSAQKAVGGLTAQRDRLSELLQSTERQYGQTANSLRSLEAEARMQEHQVAELSKRKLNVLDRIRQQRRILAGQARTAYITGRQEWLKLALQQNDPDRLSRMLTYYGYLNRARVSQLRALNQELVQMRALASDWEVEQARLRLIREQICQEQARLAEVRLSRRSVLRKLEQELADQSEALRRLRQDAAHLQEVIVALPLTVQSSSADANKAGDGGPVKPDWPVEGPLSVRFGTPRLSGKWDGVVIGAAEGTPVRAAARGKVVFSDWLRGYGLLTILDHGDGHLSLYGFNQSLFKNVGDWVEAGEAIASVGVSGGQSEPGLYFGVRKQGRPIDPLQWCAGIR